MDKQSNVSLTGDQSTSLNIKIKIGIGLFLIGILGIVYYFLHTELVPIMVISFVFILFGIILFSSSVNEFHGEKFTIYHLFNKWQILGLCCGILGMGIIIMAWLGFHFESNKFFLAIAILAIALGSLTYTFGAYGNSQKGIKNNGVWFNNMTNRGVIGIILGVLFTSFYIHLYWFGSSMNELIHLFEPFSWTLRNKSADQWFVYGTLYSCAILFLGIKFMVKYRHSKYHMYRTLSIIGAQLIFAYFIPQILESMNEGTAYFDRDLKNIWPLNYQFADPHRLSAMQEKQQFGPSGTFFFVWGLFLFLILTPILTYFVGKRWYCSWVCGCGGLAETAGDSFRHLSSKKIIAWKIERWMIHSIMVFVLIMTIASLWPYFSGNPFEIGFATITGKYYFYFTIGLLLLGAISLFLLARKHRRKVLNYGGITLLIIGLFLAIAYFTGSTKVFYIKSHEIKRAYGFFIGAIFSGIAGVGFYPILGNRVWCRFGCPMAGYMGIFQRFKSRFRITTNGGQCISCGNCSVYCEQGIDVRSYAQKGENIIRSGCVGCGVCASVCPRGVLKLENGPEEGRFEPNPIEITKDGFKLNT